MAKKASWGQEQVVWSCLNETEQLRGKQLRPAPRLRRRKRDIAWSSCRKKEIVRGIVEKMLKFCKKNVEVKNTKFENDKVRNTA